MTFDPSQDDQSHVTKPVSQPKKTGKFPKHLGTLKIDRFAPRTEAQSAAIRKASNNTSSVTSARIPSKGEIKLSGPPFVGLPPTDTAEETTDISTFTTNTRDDNHKDSSSTSNTVTDNPFKSPDAAPDEEPPTPTENNTSSGTLHQLNNLSDDEEERLREMISRSGTTTSDFIASEVLTDSEEEPSDTEEIEVPKKMSGRYREVQKPTPFKESLLKQITPDPVTGMNVISQTKMREGVHQGSTPGDSFQKLEVSAIQQDSSPSNSDEKTTENDDDELSPLQDVNEDSNRMSPTTYATAVSGLEEVTKGMQDIDLKGSDGPVTIHTSGMPNAVKSEEELRAEHDKDFTLVTKVKGNSRAVLNKKKIGRAHV